MFNKVILMGRICHDLELKTTPSGVSVLSFRIAVDRNYQVKGEDRKADFFNIVAWRSTAEFVSKYFGKGRMIMVDGELQTRQYIDKNNITQNIVEIVADSIHFTGEKPPAQNQQSGPGGAYSGSYQGTAAAHHPAETVNSAPTAVTGGAAGDFTESGGEDEYPF
ncbi:MAG: single-stranded DNA-binding protein [Oscillospiraceae bacterium]|jgi:single-strand DNA-binding protein|nr:single-stranded DNA-binding protein [Oscillospiraceae bacterium]